jgi:formate dehydrogenase subunit delta
MGNDIARQFAHLPESEAVATIQAHLLRFWSPQMRARLSLLTASDSSRDTLDPLLVAAARKLEQL